MEGLDWPTRIIFPTSNQDRLWHDGWLRLGFKKGYVILNVSHWPKDVQLGFDQVGSSDEPPGGSSAMAALVGDTATWLRRGFSRRGWLLHGRPNAAGSGAVRSAARFFSKSSVTSIGGSKGWNEPGLVQTGMVELVEGRGGASLAQGGLWWCGNGERRS
jgi:hypothetical protein